MIKNILPEEQRNKFLQFLKENKLDLQQCIDTLHYSHYKRVIDIYDLYPDALVFIGFNHFNIKVTNIDYQRCGFSTLQEWTDMFCDTYSNLIKSKEREGYYLITKREAQKYLEEYKSAA